MGVFNRDQPWTGLVVVLLIFCIDFLLHILFAALNWNLMFRIIAYEIALVVHAVGPLALLFGGPRNELAQNQAMKFGLILAMPLSMGYWWAVNDMSWAMWVPVTTLIPIALHMALWRHSSWFAGLLWPSEG